MRTPRWRTLSAALTLALLWTGCQGDGPDPLPPVHQDPSDPFRPPNPPTGDHEDHATGDVTHAPGLSLQEEDITAALAPSGLAVSLRLALSGTLGTPRDGHVIMALEDLDGEALAEGQAAFRAESEQDSIDVTVALSGTDLPSGDDLVALSAYVLAYQVEWGGEELLHGRRSLFAAAPKVETQVMASDTLYAGQTTHVRVIARDPNNGHPVANTPVAVRLLQEEGEVTLYEGNTDALGSLSAPVAIPQGLEGSGELIITAGEDQARQEAKGAIQISRAQRILVTTDKPLYQPGQIIHIRLLALAQPDLRPEADVDSVIEVMDGKGNRVFKRMDRTNEYGVVSADFALATEVNMGAYTIRALVGETETEHTVTVDRYSLPKFNVAVTLDRPFYLPSQTLQGNIEARYFFGQAVSMGALTVKASTFDVAEQVFAEVHAELDQDGKASFAIAIPDTLYGQTLDQGLATVQLEAVVTDGALHQETRYTSVAVSQSPLVLTLIPESGEVAPGLDNIFFLVLTDPTGAPQAGECSLGADQVAVNANGIGQISLAVPAEGLALDVTCHDGLGNQATQTFDFTDTALTEAILARTDKPIYRVGDTMTVSIRVTDPQERVFVDMVRSGQVVLSQTIETTSGSGELVLDVTPDMTGTVQIDAYYLARDSSILRDQRLVMVEDATDLNIGITFDKDIYAPAEEARLELTVRGADGQPVQAALSLAAVDEAVFALTDMQPGLAKAFFALQEDIMAPSYEIHGWSMTDLVLAPEDPSRQEKAEVTMAATGGVPALGIQVNTYTDMQQQVKSHVTEPFEARVDSIIEELVALAEEEEMDYYDTTALTAWLEDHGQGYIDFWGKAIDVSFDVSTQFVTFLSLGPDEIRGSRDDLTVQRSQWEFLYGSSGPISGWENDWDWMADEGAMPGGPPSATPDEEQRGGEGGEGRPRVRENFPETLYWNPLLITDTTGQAALDLPLADSITTWRLSVLASSARGQLGSTTAGITVFQDFFVDLDLPPTLTQHDELSVPVAIYSYLDRDQRVTIELEPGDWFELLDGTSKVVDVGPGEVTMVSFRVRVMDVGWQTFTVYGLGEVMSDAVRRQVEILPDGKEVNQSASDRLAANVAHTLNIPAAAIDGASKMFVKIYPGLFSQVVEGLDSLFSMPTGCFEQTTSSTWPNAMVLQYMIATDQVTPEIEVKARGYIAQGYQRLLTFEVDGGGFEWFGSPPANLILTSLGVMEFSDIADVEDTDQAVLSRTQRWLADKQRSDGSWEATDHWFETTSRTFDDDVRTTAYVAWALGYSGHSGPEVARAVAYLKQHMNEVTDTYTLGLIANALVLADDPAAMDILSTLNDMAVVEEGTSHWVSESATVTYSEGDSGDIEVTAIVTQAFLLAGAYPETTEGALAWLVQSKDSFGNWNSTQATVMALKAFLLASEGSTSSDPVDATVTIKLNDKTMDILHLTEENKDVLMQVDLSPRVIEGANLVVLELIGEGTFLYQVVSRHYIPWDEVEVPATEPMEIDVAYDRTSLTVDDTALCTVTVRNMVDDTTVNMVLVSVGVPPGFDVEGADLEALVASGLAERVETTAGQVIIYLRELAFGSPVELSYRLRARFPIEGQAPASKVYDYYNPDQGGEAPPVGVTVE